MRGLSLSKPAIGLGSLWVLAGDSRDLQLLRMNPTTLALRSRTRLPVGAPLNAVIADADHVYLVGTAIASVNARGQLIAAPIPAPNLAAAAIYKDGLVGLNDASPALELLKTNGIDVESLISEERPLDDGLRAIGRASEPGVMKVLLRP